MSLLAPDTFATALFGLMRLGQEGRRAFLTAQANRHDLSTLSPDPAWFTDDPERGEQLLARWAAFDMVMASGEAEPGAQFEGVLEREPVSGAPMERNGWPVVAPGRERDFERAVAWALAQHHQARARDMTDGIVLFHQRQWLEGNPRSPWGQFARHLLDVSLDVVAINPAVFGGGRKARTLIAALAPNLAAAYDPDTADASSAPVRLAEAFAEAALNTMADRPDLIDDDPRWAPLISGVLEPLQAEVEANGARYIIAEGRLRDLFSGPMAHAALSAISHNADAFLKGSAGGEKILGAILRGTLGEVTSTDPGAFRLRQVFSEAGVHTIVNSALQVASTRPELFIRSGSGDDEIVHGRAFLSRFADILLEAPRPYGEEEGLGAEVTAMAIEVVGDYAHARLLANASEHADSQMGADIAAHLLRDLLAGFSNTETDMGGSPLAGVLSRAQAVDVLRILATHVARAPDAMLGEQTNPVIRNMAEAVAQAIASDTDGLLTGEDWREVIALAFDAALLNPGTLFSLDPGDGPGDSLALVLIRQMLATARENMGAEPAISGRILFGATLREAIKVTLLAASNGILSTFRNRADMLDHLGAVDLLAARLNQLATSHDRQLVIGAQEWLEIYTYYIAHALETGRAGIEGLSDTQLVAVLKSVAGQSETGGTLG